MKVIIMGGTKGMGRAMSQQLAMRGDSIWLLGRNPEELQRSTADLDARSAALTGHSVCDLSEPEGFEEALEEAFRAMGRVDCFILTAAMFGTQEQLEADLEWTHKLTTVNFANTIVLCERLRIRLLKQGGGTLCVFSSVAGDRGRKTNGIYGATKAGLSHYLESLDHKYRDQGLVTLCVKPGFVKTGMTEGLKPPPFSGEPEEVAQRVIRAIDGQAPMVYAPFMWRWVMLVIKFLPRFVMRRVGF